MSDPESYSDYQKQVEGLYDEEPLFHEEEGESYSDYQRRINGE